MATKRNILETLKHADLVGLVNHFELEVKGRKTKASCTDALAASRKASRDAILSELKLSTIKAVLQSLELPSTGRSKAALLEHFNGKTSPRAKKAPAKKETAKKKSAAKKPTEAKQEATKASPKKAAVKKAPANKKATEAKQEAKKTSAKKAAANKKPANKKAAEAKQEAKKPTTKKKTKTQKGAPAAPKTRKGAAAKTAPEEPAVEVADAPSPAPSPAPHANEDGNIQPRAFVFEKVAQIQPAKTSQPDYSRVVREVQAKSAFQSCGSCGVQLEIVTCQIHDCEEKFILNPDKRRICASCWYERSSVSIGEYLEEEQKDTHCWSCQSEVTLS